MGDLPMKKGMYVLFSVQMLHNNPELWSEPDKFDPERYCIHTPMYGTSHNKVIVRTYIRLYSYLFNARTRATPVPVPIHVYTPIARAVSYKTGDAKRTVFSDLATFVHTNVLLMC